MVVSESLSAAKRLEQCSPTSECRDLMPQVTSPSWETDLGHSWAGRESGLSAGSGFLQLPLSPCGCSGC